MKNKDIEKAIVLLKNFIEYEEIKKKSKSHADKNMSTICVGLVNEHLTNPKNNSV